jgi:UDP-3-O-[3-hydroxymyristoyl] glucosamine N-acyltransferase
MQRTAAELAEFLGGTLEGNGDVKVHALTKIEEGVTGGLTFLANLDYEGYIYTTQASVAIVGKSFQPSQDLPSHLSIIRVNEPYAAFGRLLELVSNLEERPLGIHPSAIVDPGAVIGENCRIAAFVVIEAGARIGSGCDIRSHSYIGRNASVGEDCTLHASTQIMDGCIVGKSCILHPRVIIGSDGFGFAPQNDSSYRKVPQTGNVIVGDHCEIGAGTTIDRATLGSTRLEEGVKLDNLIQVAHNVTIGAHTVIAAQTGIAGSTHIGAHCLIGGQVGIAGHIRIADGVRIAAQSGVSASITREDGTYQGTPAMPIKDFQKQQLALRKVTREELLKRVNQLEIQLNQIRSSSRNKN